jgi:undecaprenyl-diphosphatase
MASDLIQAAVLGVVQGLTEFLPISSTGHLIVVPALLGWDSPLVHRLDFRIALHLGTAVAVVGVFWRDWFTLSGAALRSLRDRSLVEPEARLAWLIALGTIPAAAAGALFAQEVECVLSSPMIVGAMMIGVGIVLAAVDHLARLDRDEYELGPIGALAIGIGQAVALIPGTSRSGSTIAVGLALGLKRTSAARFSFLLSAPITIGALAKQSVDVARHSPPTSDLAMYGVGVLAAGISGALAIHGLLRFLRSRSLMPFVVYRIIAGGIVLAASGRLPNPPICQ